MIEIVIGVIGLAIGAAASWFVVNKSTTGKAKLILDNAEKEGEQIKKDKMLQAKEKFLELKAEHEKVIAERNQKAAANENKIAQRNNWWML